MRWQHAWLLVDNGQYASAEVSRMVVTEIEAAYDDPVLKPEYAFNTEMGDNGKP